MLNKNLPILHWQDILRSTWVSERYRLQLIEPQLGEQKEELYCWPWIGGVVDIVNNGETEKQLADSGFWMKTFSKYKPLGVEVFNDENDQTAQAVVHFEIGMVLKMQWILKSHLKLVVTTRSGLPIKGILVLVSMDGLPVQMIIMHRARWETTFATIEN